MIQTDDNQIARNYLKPIKGDILEDKGFMLGNPFKERIHPTDNFSVEYRNYIG